MLRNFVSGGGPETSQGPATPLERRSQTIQNRRNIIGGRDELEGEAEEDDELAQLPDNVDVATDDPDDEQIKVAQENADRFHRIIVMEGWKVDAKAHESGGRLTLREFEDEVFTLDRDRLAGEPEPEKTEFTTPVRSMSEAADTLKGRKGLPEV